MSLDERERAELFEGLVPTLGREVTVKLVDALPPAGQPLATAHQVATLEQRIDDRFTVVEQRMDDRFTAVDQRFTNLEQRLDDRFAAVDARIEAMGDRLLASFRGELNTAVSGQTRAVIIATATAVFGIGGLALTLAQVLG